MDLNPPSRPRSVKPTLTPSTAAPAAAAEAAAGEFVKAAAMGHCRATIRCQRKVQRKKRTRPWRLAPVPLLLPVANRWRSCLPKSPRRGGRRSCHRKGLTAASPRPRPFGLTTAALLENTEESRDNNNSCVTVARWWRSRPPRGVTRSGAKRRHWERDHYRARGPWRPEDERASGRGAPPCPPGRSTR